MKRLISLLLVLIIVLLIPACNYYAGDYSDDNVINSDEVIKANEKKLPEQTQTPKDSFGDDLKKDNQTSETND